jgi:hypothetical protein
MQVRLRHHSRSARPVHTRRTTLLPGQTFRPLCPHRLLSPVRPYPIPAAPSSLSLPAPPSAPSITTLGHYRLLAKGHSSLCPPFSVIGSLPRCGVGASRKREDFRSNAAPRWSESRHRTAQTILISPPLPCTRTKSTYGSVRIGRRSWINQVNGSRILSASVHTDLHYKLLFQKSHLVNTHNRAAFLRRLSAASIAL